MDTQKKKLGEMIKDNLQKVVIIIVSILYVIQGLFSIAKKDTTIIEILGTIGVSIIVGITISNAFNSWGIKDGMNSSKFLTSCEVYGKAKIEATPNLDKLSAWCTYKNSQELEYKKKQIIQSSGLKWKAYKLGYYAEHTDKLKEEQINALKQADELKIEVINPDDLLNISVSDTFKKFGRFGKSIKQFEKINFYTDLTSKVGLGIICGLYGLAPLITKENASSVLASMVWNTMQIALWLSLGIIKYSNAKSFIEDDYRQNNIILKTEYLNEFIITLKNNPKVIEEYDNDEDIERYIEQLIKEREKNEEICN